MSSEGWGLPGALAWEEDRPGYRALPALVAGLLVPGDDRWQGVRID